MAATPDSRTDDKLTSSGELPPQGTKHCPINIDQPQWDQAYFTGRLKRFVAITNPLLIFKSANELQKVQALVEGAR